MNKVAKVVEKLQDTTDRFTRYVAGQNLIMSQNEKCQEESNINDLCNECYDLIESSLPENYIMPESEINFDDIEDEAEKCVYIKRETKNKLLEHLYSIGVDFSELINEESVEIIKIKANKLLSAEFDHGYMFDDLAEGKSSEQIEVAKYMLNYVLCNNDNDDDDECQIILNEHKKPLNYDEIEKIEIVLGNNENYFTEGYKNAYIDQLQGDVDSFIKEITKILDNL